MRIYEKIGRVLLTLVLGLIVPLILLSFLLAGVLQIYDTVKDVL